MISRTDLISAAEQTSGRMLGPSAYSEALLPSLRLAKSSRYARRVGKLLLFALVIGFGGVAIAPWQQSVTGGGGVTALDPAQRPQNIEVPIKGRLKSWGPGIRENVHVRKGQLIAEIEDVDPELITRLRAQQSQMQSLVNNSKLNWEAKKSSLQSAKDVVGSQDALMRTYQAGMQQTLASADAAIAGAKNKITAEERQLDELKAALDQVKLDYTRQKDLFEDDVVARKTYEMAERKFREADFKVKKQSEYVSAATNLLEEKTRDRASKEQKALGEIDYARSLLDKSKKEVASAEGDVAKAEADWNKAQKMLSEMETKVSRQAQEIRAPAEGVLTKILANDGGQMVKDGDTLCVIVPDTVELAVEILLDGNDAPLVEVGRHVRLQFHGWPAVQFAGWPSVAVGTFGGVVQSIDATDNGKGKFRVLVRPDDEVNEWPDERYLRQGVRANAWVLLEQVPLWYEIWRNMNGFPPVVTQDEDEKQKTKKPKLPK